MLWPIAFTQRHTPLGAVAMTCTVRPGYPSESGNHEALDRWRS